MRGAALVFAALILVPSFLTDQVTAEEPAYSFEDAADDVAVEGEGTFPAALAPVDVRRVTIEGENETGLWIHVQTNPFQEAAEEGQATGTGSLLLRFETALDVVSFSVLVRYEVHGVGPSPTVRTVDGLVSYCASDERGCLRQPYLPPMRPADGVWSIWVDKRELEGTPGASQWMPLEEGQEFEDLWVTAAFRGFDFVAATDEAHAPGARPYRLQRPTDAPKIGAMTEQGRWNVAVVEGERHSLGLILRNREPQKQLLRLQYAASSQGSPVEVLGPASVAVAGTDSRVVMLSIAIPELPPEERTVALTVRLSAVGREGLARTEEFTLDPQPLLDPMSPRIFLHRHEDSGHASGPCGYEDCKQAFFSFREADPAMSGRNVFRLVGDEHIDLFVSASPKFPAAVRMERAGPLTLALRASVNSTRPEGTEVTCEATVEWTLPNWELGLASLAGTARLSREPAWLNLSARWPSATVILPPGTRLLGRVQCSFGEGDLFSRPDELIIEGARSHLLLPIVEAPRRHDAYAAGAFQLIALDQEHFLNPGQTRQYNLSVANIQAQPHRASLRVSAPPGWEARIEPGTMYDLEAGQEVRPALLLRSPASAAEGERVTVGVLVSDEAGHTVLRNVTATVVTAVTLPDDEGRYGPDPEAVGRLATEGSPGIPSFGVVPLLLALGWLSARRRASGAR